MAIEIFKQISMFFRFKEDKFIDKYDAKFQDRYNENNEIIVLQNMNTTITLNTK